MKRKIAWMLLAALLLCCMSGCAGQGNGEGTPSSSSTEIRKPDGLTADGKFYQLTDRQGRQILIPIGKPLPVKTFEVSKTAAGDGAKLTFLTDKDSAVPSYVLILTAEDSIALGGGDVVLSNGKTVCDPDGKAYTSSEDNVLLQQYYNAKDEVVPKGAADATKVWIAERKYLHDSKLFLNVMDLWYDLTSDEVILWNYDENPTDGDIYSDGRVVARSWEYYRGETERRMEELIHMDVNGGTFMPVKECWYGDDWQLLRKNEYAWHDTGKTAQEYRYVGELLEFHGEYDLQGRPLKAKQYREDGSLYVEGLMGVDGVYVYQVYDHGVLLHTGYNYYDANGKFIGDKIQYPDGTWEDRMPKGNAL